MRSQVLNGLCREMEWHHRCCERFHRWIISNDMPRVFGLVLMLFAFGQASQSSAQVFKALYSFAGSSAIQRIDLVLSNDTLFGTMDGDGATNQGSVFKLKTDGTGFTNLHSFIESDGAYPSG